MSGSFYAGPASGLFLLADISDYTGFLRAMGTAHRDDTAVARLQVPISGSTPLTETYDHYPPIGVALFPLR